MNDKSLTHIRKSRRRAYFREKIDIKDSGFDLSNFIHIFISKKVIIKSCFKRKFIDRAITLRIHQYIKGIYTCASRDH